MSRPAFPATIASCHLFLAGIDEAESRTLHLAVCFGFTRGLMPEAERDEGFLLLASFFRGQMLAADEREYRRP